MEERKEIDLIFGKFLDNTCSREEFEILKQYLRKPGAQKHIRKLMKEDGELVRRYRPLMDGTASEGSKASFDKILQAIGKKEEGLLAENKQRIRSGNSWYIPALVFTAVVACAWIIFKVNYSGMSETAWLETATLPGQKATITLRDGSTVLLNSGSKLIYPRQFGDSREVTLQGEAFFMVARDEQRPFTIKSGELTTKVLGTSFNIRAFENENIEVTVATGKVSVNSPLEGGRGVSKPPLILTPNQQAVYDVAAGSIGLKEVDAGYYLAWREGVLRLDNISLEEVAKKLERWYGVKVILENERIANCVIIGGEFQNQSLHSVLRTVGVALDITYEFTENGVMIRGEGCLAR